MIDGMAKEQYKYVEVQIPATPRNKRLTDSIQAAAQTGGGGGSIGYPSTPQYWELVTTATDGSTLEEAQYYLRPVTGKHVVVPGDVVAFADGGEYGRQSAVVHVFVLLRICAAISKTTGPADKRTTVQPHCAADRGAPPPLSVITRLYAPTAIPCP